MCVAASISTPCLALLLLNMLALCSSLYEYEHTNHQHAVRTATTIPMLRTLQQHIHLYRSAVQGVSGSTASLSLRTHALPQMTYSESRPRIASMDQDPESSELRPFNGPWL